MRGHTTAMRPTHQTTFPGPEDRDVEPPGWPLGALVFLRGSVSADELFVLSLFTSLVKTTSEP